MCLLMLLYQMPEPSNALPPNIETLANLVNRLEGIPLAHIHLHPTPGMKTVADVVEIERRENRLCALVDAVLVEKAIGFKEPILAALLTTFLQDFVGPQNLGIVVGAGTIRFPRIWCASRTPPR
jgi:hypothetical protein